jgi:hypothetical protein
VVHESCQRYGYPPVTKSFPRHGVTGSDGLLQWAQANIFLVHRIAPVNLALVQTAKRDKDGEPVDAMRVN